MSYSLSSKITPTTPVTPCSCHPSAALLLVGISRGHCAAFLGHWGCPRPLSPKRWHTSRVPGRGWPCGPQEARPLAQWCCPRLPAVPPTAYLQRLSGDDPGDGDPTINCAVSLDCYRNPIFSLLHTIMTLVSAACFSLKLSCALWLLSVCSHFYYYVHYFYYLWFCFFCYILISLGFFSYLFLFSFLIIVFAAYIRSLAAFPLKFGGLTLPANAF